MIENNKFELLSWLLSFSDKNLAYVCWTLYAFFSTISGILSQDKIHKMWMLFASLKLQFVMRRDTDNDATIEMNSLY